MFTLEKLSLSVKRSADVTRCISNSNVSQFDHRAAAWLPAELAGGSLQTHQISPWCNVGNDSIPLGSDASLCVCVLRLMFNQRGLASRSSMIWHTGEDESSQTHVWRTEPWQQPHNRHQFLELLEEKENLKHTHTPFFKSGANGRLPHNPGHTHQEVIVGEQQQVSERVFLQLVPKFRDDGLIVEWIYGLRLLLLRRHASDSRLAWQRSLPEAKANVQPCRLEL